jgi:hypothetical protein
MPIFMQRIRNPKPFLQLMFLLFVMTAAGGSFAEKKLVHSVDFTKQPEGDARPWFEEKGYLMKLDADDIEVTFKDKQLNLQTKEPKTAIFGLKLKPENYLADISSIEIEWGVVKQPKGANWEAGNNRVPIAFMFFFGTEEVSSGLPFGINSAPYFLSPFIGLKEQPGKVYLGKLYRDGGRYICVAVTNGSKNLIKSTLKIDPRYLKLFEKDAIPPITAIAFQMNTLDTQGGAHAFIRKLRFYSDK